MVAWHPPHPLSSMSSLSTMSIFPISYITTNARRIKTLKHHRLHHSLQTANRMNCIFKKSPCRTRRILLLFFFVCFTAVLKNFYNRSNNVSSSTTQMGLMYVEKSEESGRNETERQKRNLLLKTRLEVKETRQETTTLEDFSSTKRENEFSKSELNHSISNTSVQYRQQLDDAIQSMKYIPEDEYLQDNSSFFKLKSHVVNSFVPEVLIQASLPCSNDSPFLLVALLSVPVNSDQRKAIRKTWGSIAQGKTWPRKSVSVNIKLLFFMGINSAANMSNLKAESERHGDIVLGNFLDTYRNLSVKVAFVISWTINYCTNATHLMKVDEDTFVNVPLLTDMLQNVSRQHTRYIIGFKHASDKPPVVRRDQWKVSENVYPLSLFPRHVIGASYVLSNEAFKKLYTAYQHMRLVPVEDAFFTGILAKTMDILRIYSPLFASGLKGDICLLLEDKLVSQTFYGGAFALNTIWSIIVDDKC